MRPLSAAEAIQPAIHRAKTVLFEPFRIGRTWKLAATAYLAAMGAFFIPTPFFSYLAKASQPHSKVIPLLISLGLSALISAITFAFFFIGTRLEFVLFDIVLLNEKFVAPAWRRHGHHIWRWIGFKVVLSLILCLLCGPFFYIAYRDLVPQLAALSTPGQPPSFAIFGVLMRFYALIGLPIGFAILVSSVLTNFVLPSIAIEDTTAREGLFRFLSLVRSQPGPVSFYVLLKAILGIAGFMAMEAAVVLGELLCLIPIGLIALAGWFLLRSAGSAGHVIMLAGAVLLLLVFIVFVTYCATIAIGALHIFFQAYALYFLGGYYPALGDLLEPPGPAYAPPPPIVTAPATIPPAEPAV